MKYSKTLDTRIKTLLTDFFTDANAVCGSEGLFQSIFYHHGRSHFAADRIFREYKVPSGSIDFVIDGGNQLFAFELKGGANGHRNSLANMKEVEHSGKGLSHDIKKLVEFGRLNKGKTVQVWLVCIDLAPLDIAFDDNDLSYYSNMANKSDACLAYLAQGEKYFLTFDNGQRVPYPISQQVQPSSLTDHKKIIQDDKFWRAYFSETNRTPGLECVHIGQLYHALRGAGFNYNQCASEVFFNCNRYGTRNYYIMDFAVFSSAFCGQFQLYGNSRKTIENDKFKLPHLIALMEFKGGDAFQKKSLRNKVADIEKDLNKLASKVSPNVLSASSQLDIKAVTGSPELVMVVTDPDTELRADILSLQARYRDKVEIRWCGK